MTREDLVKLKEAIIRSYGYILLGISLAAVYVFVFRRRLQINLYELLTLAIAVVYILYSFVKLMKSIFVKKNK